MAMGLRAGIWASAGIAYRQAALMSPQFRSVPPRLASTRVAGAGEASPSRGKLLEAHCNSCRPERHLDTSARQSRLAEANAGAEERRLWHEMSGSEPSRGEMC